MEFDGIILSHSMSSNVLVLTLVLGKYLQIDIFFTPEISLILSSERAFLERYEHDILRKHTNVFPRNTGGYEIQLYFKFSKLYPRDISGNCFLGSPEPSIQLTASNSCTALTRAKPIHLAKMGVQETGRCSNWVG